MLSLLYLGMTSDPEAAQPKVVLGPDDPELSTCDCQFRLLPESSVPEDASLVDIISSVVSLVTWFGGRAILVYVLLFNGLSEAASELNALQAFEPPPPPCFPTAGRPSCEELSRQANEQEEGNANAFFIMGLVMEGIVILARCPLIATFVFSSLRLVKKAALQKLN